MLAPAALRKQARHANSVLIENETRKKTAVLGM